MPGVSQKIGAISGAPVGTIWRPGASVEDSLR